MSRWEWFVWGGACLWWLVFGLGLLPKWFVLRAQFNAGGPAKPKDLLGLFLVPALNLLWPTILVVAYFVEHSGVLLLAGFPIAYWSAAYYAAKKVRKWEGEGRVLQ